MATERDYSGLTEEERALLEEDESLVDGIDTEEEDEKAPKSDDDSGDEKQAEGDAATGEIEEEEEEVELRRDPAPMLPTDAPKDADDRLKALVDEKAALIQKFDDGEITAREYSDRLEEIADKRNDIKWEKQKAEIGREMHERAYNDAWERDVHEFLTGPAKAIADKGEPALLAFDSYVKKVTGDAANAKLSNRAQLDKAHKAFLKDFGGTFGDAPKPNQKTQEEEAKQEAKKERKIPPTLARVPASDIESVDEGKFAALDRLAETNPLAYQKRIAKMTPQEREEYGI